MAVLEMTGEMVTVYPFSEKLPAVQEVPIATCVTMWESPETGEPWMLVVHEALYFGNNLKESLLCPNQIRAAGNIVNDTPIQFDAASSHSIKVPNRVELPLEMRGVISFLSTRLPTESELESYRSGYLQFVELTARTPWEPYSSKFAVSEDAARNNRSVRVTYDTLSCHTCDNCESEESCSCKPRRSPTLTERCVAVVSRISHIPVELYGDDGQFASRLVAAVNIESFAKNGDGLDGLPEDSICLMSEEDRRLCGLSSRDRGPVITKEILAKRWGIGLDTAHKTLSTTTQFGVRKVLHPVERRYRTRQAQLRFPTLNTKLYTDTLFSSTKSIHGNKCAQVFTNGIGFDLFYPLKAEADIGDALNEVVRTIGVPKELVSDGAKAETQGRFAAVANEYRIKQRITEPYSGWQNRAEAAIREIKKGIKRAMLRARSPKRLWDYCGEWVAAVRRLTAHDIPALQGRVPTELIEGNTPDISEFAQFDWYQLVWYIDPAVRFPDDTRKLGRWIGVAHDVGSPMTFWVLPQSCKVLARSTVTAVTEDELSDPIIQGRIAELDLSIKSKIGDALKDDEIDEELLALLPEIPDDVFLPDQVDEPAETDASMPEADDYTPEAYDEYLTAEVLLPNMGTITKAKVVGRKRDADGTPIGKRHNNPILDTREYEVEFPDGATDVFTANIIAENLYAQVDDEGNSYSILGEIIDHKKDGSAVSLDDAFMATKDGVRRRRRTTKGWKMNVTWKDGSSSWVPLKDLKESNPVQVAEYAVANKILEEPAFAWWARHVLKKRDRIIRKVKSRYWDRTHKYGILLPKSVAEALRIDRDTGTTFWQKAIEKEIGTIEVAVGFPEDNAAPVGYQKIDCHMIFDVKMTLERKARFVAGGHQTEPTKDITFASVVSRDSIRLAFLIAALNDLEILSADVSGAYLNAKAAEKVYFIAGKEFGPHQETRTCVI